MNLSNLRTFCLVAEAGTIRAAADRLAVPKSTVSRRIQRLEDELGQDLLVRTPRAIALTKHGQALHQRCAPALQELYAAAEALRHAQTEPAGTLRITTVPGFGHSHSFLACLRDFGLKHPNVQTELELTTRLVNLVEESFDVGIRLHLGSLPPSPGLMTRRLLRFARGLFASPRYLESAGAPANLEALAKHRIAAHSIVDVRKQQWTYRVKPFAQPQLLPKPTWLLNDSAALERFLQSGAGIGLLPTYVATDLVERGDLVRVLEDFEQTGATASLVWPASRHLAPRIRAFIDHAVATLGDATN